MSGWFGAVWPVLTFVLGLAVGFARDVFTQRRQDQREEKARRHERAVAAIERRETFELEHLQRLHSALSALTRAAARLHAADRETSRDTGVYAGTRIDGEIGQALTDANREVHALNGLVLDDGLRERVLQAVVAMNRPVVCIASRSRKARMP